jgi:hypothetical protein
MAQQRTKHSNAQCADAFGIETCWGHFRRGIAVKDSLDTQLQPLDIKALLPLPPDNSCISYACAWVDVRTPLLVLKVLALTGHLP